MSPIENIELVVNRLRSLPHETETVEFKSSNADPAQIGKDICALANSAALLEKRFAYKVWGIDDKTHEIAGTNFDPRAERHGSQSLELWLRIKLSQNVQFEFESTLVDDKLVVILRIWPAVSQIALFDGKPYIRTDSSTQELKRGSAREHELFQRIQKAVYETQVAKSGMALDDVLTSLDVAAYFERQDIQVPESVDSIAHYLEREQLIISQDDGLYSVTNMGALLFAKRLSDFPEVQRKAARVIQYEDKSRLVISRTKTFDAGYVLCLDEIDEYIATIAGSREIIERATRRTVPQFPSIAVRELVANALIHQDFFYTGTGPMVELFPNRLEITNPGTPLVDVLRILNDPPRSRNEKMAALLRRLNLCEEAGSGWDKVVAACELRRLPAPRIDVSDTAMQVSLFSAIPFRDLMPEERMLSCYWHACSKYANKETASNQSIRERFGLPSSASAQVSRLIKECIDAGYIRALDQGASRRYMRYIPAWV